MATQYKTKCPHCQAQFRISEEHLKQAKGQVRCGSCLKVFLATENLVPDNAAAQKPAAKPAPKPAQAAPAKPAAAPPKPAAPATPETWSLPVEEPAKEAPASRWTLDDDGLSDDMKDADEPNDFDEEGIPEARPQANDTKLSLGGLELSDSFMSLDSDDDDDRLRDEDFSDMAGAARGGQSEDSDESWAEKLLEELSDEPKPVKNPSAAQMQLTQTEAEQRREQERSDKAQRKAGRAPSPQQSEPDWAQDSDGFFSDEALGGDDGFGLLDSDYPDDDLAPIELPKAAKPSVADKLPVKALMGSGTELLRWGGLSVLMLMLLLGQYLAFNFNELGRTPEWRGFYSTVCGAVGCTLPNPSDVTRLRGANLVVREHPGIDNALVVDLLLFNKADYEQPFPLLELGFTALDGTTVASRRFTPDEYLKGDLAGADGMPINTPIHISLEILNPGDQAKNYTLRLFPNPPRGA